MRVKGDQESPFFIYYNKNRIFSRSLAKLVNSKFQNPYKKDNLG